jgi:hypothetical protein
MGAEFEGLKFRGEGDQSMGEKMVEVAVALMRKVDDRLERMESKLDDIGKERMAEARKAGENSAKVKALEEFKAQHLDDHRWLWRAIVGACIAAAGSVIVALFRR